MNIRQMKLISGDEIVCLVSSDNDTNYLVETPLQVQLVAGSVAKYQLIPWFSLSSTTLISINKSNVISHCEVDDDIKHHYISLALDDGSHTNDLNEDQFDMFDDNEVIEESEEYYDYLTDPIKIVH